jgi:hypothetical protein
MQWKDLSMVNFLRSLKQAINESRFRLEQDALQVTLFIFSFKKMYCKKLAETVAQVRSPSGRGGIMAESIRS